MKKYEKRAFLRSFFIFFSLQALLLFLIAVEDFNLQKRQFDSELLSNMKICSYNLKCKEFDIDFVKKANQKLQTLLKDSDEIYSLYDAQSVKEYYLKIIYPKSEYLSSIKKLKEKLFKKYIIYIFLIIALSILFSLYSLEPIKKALKINEEFIKDIVHDLNTPLSSMVINLKLLAKEFGQSKKVDRMQNSVDTIVSLQNNLKEFLNNSSLQKEQVDVKELVEKKVEYFQTLYPNKLFQTNLNSLSLYTSLDALSRIFDNLLSNACKYSPKNGIINISIKGDKLTIEDNGEGIEDTKKVFQRYYKENQRGLGIGLSIVKKLCDELGFEINLFSQKGKGTRVELILK